MGVAPSEGCHRCDAGEGRSVGEAKAMEKKTAMEILENRIARLSQGQLGGEYEKLPEEFAAIEESLHKLEAMHQELAEYTKELSQGNMETDMPGRKNYLAAGIKSLHTSLRHIIWQVEQVGKGDYSQQIDFMGSFADSFNIMIDQLRRREQTFLDRQIAFMGIFNAMSNMVAVIDDVQMKPLFLNLSAVNHCANVYEEYPESERVEAFMRVLLGNLPEDPANPYFYHERTKRWYQIECARIEWEEDESVLVCLLTDITHIKDIEANLRQAAQIDALTSVYRRDAGLALFEQRMRQSIAYVEYVVVFVDVNDLKKINDTFGHATGDDVIIATARILQHCLRDSDIIMRVGGDEFVAVLMHCDQDIANRVLERISAHVEKHNAQQKKAYTLSLAIGLSSVSYDMNQLAAKMEEADAAMYKVKAIQKKANAAETG